jgi:hypothetical protein
MTQKQQIPPIIIQIAILTSTCVGIGNFSLGIYRLATEQKSQQPTIIIMPFEPAQKEFFTTSPSSIK